MQTILNKLKYITEFLIKEIIKFIKLVVVK